MSWSMAERSAVLTDTDLHQIKWLLGGVLTLIAQWALLSIDFVGSGFMLLLLCVLISALLRPSLPGLLPTVFWKAVAPALIVLIGADLFIGLRGGGSTVESILRMTSLLTFVRGFQYRSRREDLQLALLCLFALVITGVLTTSLTFAFQMLLFAPLAMVFLFLVNLLESGRERTMRRDDWYAFRWGRLLDRLRRSLNLRLFSIASVLFLVMAAIGTGIFMAIPRFNFDRGLNFLQLSTGGQVGFSDRVGFGEVNELSQEESEALRIQPPSRDLVPDRPYWRIMVLDRHVNGDFINSVINQPGAARRGKGRAYSTVSPSRQGAEFAEGSWQVYMEPGVSQYLAFLGPFDQLSFSKTISYTVDEQQMIFKLGSVGMDVFGYQVENMAASATLTASPREIDLLSGRGAIPEAYDEDGRRVPLDYPLTTLEVPREGLYLEYLQGVVREINGGRLMMPGEFADAAAGWLQANFRYDFQDTATYDGSEYPVVDWLRTADRGWCEHFAGALTMLARVQGIPTRLVVGYAGATWNDAGGFLTVRQSNAHAWVEFFDGQAWRRYDPTPVGDAAIIGDSSRGAALATSVGTFSGWQAWLDSLRMAWYRRVVNFDQRDQEEIAEEVKSKSEALVSSLNERLGAFMLALREWFTQGWSWQKVLTLALWGLALSLCLVALRLAWWTAFRLYARDGRARRWQIERSRKQASRMLRRFRPACARWAQEAAEPAQRRRWRNTLEALLAIRFGDLSATPDPNETLRQAKRLLARPTKA